MPRLAVRLLHAGLRDVAVGAYERHGRAARGRRASELADDAVRQPVPLHRLPADPRRRRADVRPAAPSRSTPRRRWRALRDAAARRAAALRSTPAGGFHAPRTLDELAALRAERPAGDASSPARPTSACGSPSSSATAELIYVGEVAELKRIERRATACSRSAPARRSRTPGARWSRAGRRWPRSGCASPRCRSATPARWAATSPTARRSATRRRC